MTRLLTLFAMLLCVSSHAQDNPIIQITKVERTDSSIVVQGTAKLIPGGTQFWVEVKSINGKPLSDRHVVKTPDKVFTEADGHFVATLKRFGSLDRFDFPVGVYRLEFFAGFGRSWQTVEVARAVGVKLDDQGRSDLGEPHALPKSSDLVARTTGGERVRFLTALRTVNVPAALSTSAYKTKAVRLEIRDPGSPKSPVREIGATDLLFREVPSKVGRVASGLTVALVCIGDFGNGVSTYFNYLYTSDGRPNKIFKVDYATTLKELCYQQEDDPRKRHER